ncbi:MAG: hypothetical protein NUW37_01345 [Planctomycetes bacterium]|nr:hypothetical protein [Planctomycetota bacterium]
MKKPLLVYHGQCLDGFGAAFAGYLKHKDNLEYVALEHGDDYSKVDFDDRHVMVFDFSFKPEVAEDVFRRASKFEIVDHHVSAEKELSGKPYATFDLSKSGAVLAYEYFFPDAQLPEMYRHIQDKDLWQWVVPDSDAVTCALQSYPYDFAVWSEVYEKPIRDLVIEGRAILRYRDKLVAEVMRNLVLKDFAGFRVPVVNSATFGSELGNAMVKGHPFAVIYSILADGRVRYQLRSTDSGEDVSVIAQKLGGGGHRNAASFIGDKLLF